MNSLESYTLQKTISKAVSDKADSIDFEALTDSTLTYNENKQLIQEQCQIVKEPTKAEANAQEIAFNLAEKAELEQRLAEINTNLQKNGVNESKTPPYAVKLDKKTISKVKQSKISEIEANYNLKCEGMDETGYPILKLTNRKAKYKIWKARPRNFAYPGRQGLAIKQTENDYDLLFIGWENEFIEVMV